MPFILDASGNIATQEINGQKLPIFKGADGKEAPFDGDGTVATISRLNGEAKGHRERAEAAEGKLKAFDGIPDAEAARKALNTVSSLDAKKLVDAGEVDKVKNEAINSVRKEFEPVVAERDNLRGQLHNELIGGAFARSKFIADKVAIPSDLVQASFGRHFAIEGGKIVAKDASGNQLFSRTRHGEPATFDEALEIVIDAYPHKASILKGSNASGGGAQGGGNGGGGGKTITRAQLEAMPPESRGAALKGVTLTE